MRTFSFILVAICQGRAAATAAPRSIVNGIGRSLPAFVGSSSIIRTNINNNGLSHRRSSCIAPPQQNERRTLRISEIFSAKDDCVITKPGSSDELSDESGTDLGMDVTGSSSTDRYSDSFGALLPIAEAVDAATGGWGLSYADLQPATPRTPAGIAFLATNIFYAAAGIALALHGEYLMGGLTEVAGVVSFWYHYSQLELGKDRSEVRLALLVDYCTAGAALICGFTYMAQAGISSVPFEALVAAVGAVVCLALCWVWEFGLPYIFWHSLWHMLSAATGYLIGNWHISSL